MKKSVLVFVSGYYPGFKSGGPARTIENMIRALGGEFDFRVVCLDRDSGDKDPYEGIQAGKWYKHGLASIFYVEPSFRGLLRIVEVAWKNRSAIFHLNSFFSLRFGIIPFFCSLFFTGAKRTIIGPRGEFSIGALGIKARKKQLFISFVKSGGWYSRVVWHASTEYERRDIERVIGEHAIVVEAVDLSMADPAIEIKNRTKGEPLRVIFFSRISPKKNLRGALEVLKNAGVTANFDIYGPKEDEEYWKECAKLIGELPKNIQVSYCGILRPEEIQQHVATYDVFLFPTLGENYGHVIAEALLAGVPVLLSDTTPWRGLQQENVGWDFDLNNIDGFHSALRYCASLPPETYMQWREHIRKWAAKNISKVSDINANRKLFNFFDA